MIDKQELLRLYNLDLDELLKLSSKYVKDEIEFCSLINARNGKCSQNCKYCAQSSHYRTHIDSYPLVKIEEVRKAALDAKSHKASRFAIVTSGKTPDESDFDKMLEMIKEINKIEGLNSCASIGILNEEQAKKLAQSGLKRFHHNINTAKSYYPEVCTTHTWQDRLDTCKLVKKYGMELCCGVILGMGESVEQRVEMALELAEIQPNSIPINILMPIPETPFENYLDKIDEENVLRTLAIFKIANPNSILRFCGGRMRLSEENQRKALNTCVEGIMVGNYLTTIGKNPDDDIKTVEELGKTIATN
ncbi:biotin synthase BioB [Candidatus Melainabacteria bacterium MEL.A1]|jgi:biotin synthase|nr:biotin synthase BioB [Candidatus Melainabacteria bacterium MEL.A1]CCX80029.1 biotin synthase [Clostridium sp. CAG:715]DAA81095.1 MAG TPA: biotin synthase BioB [Candidatus Gastranaerophilales bacterium HUM_2]